SPERVQHAYNYLKKKYPFKEAVSCTEADILLVHTPEHLERVKRLNFYDPDTPQIPDIYEHGRLSIGGAIQAAQKTDSFSLMRPPGHHAGKNFLGGFCYFNNIAIAVIKVLPKYKKIAILDIDGHHGNGTEEIFKRHSEVIYVSLHQFPAYPGTGLSSSGNIKNFPLPPGTSSPRYLKKFEKAVEEIDSFKPKLLAISAGFDAYEEDPLLQLALKIDTYFKIGKILKELKLPFFAVLEGGYTNRVGEGIDNLLRGLQE
ncbi:MAG TPA: histone deacetylase, partial [Candidatus Omnitrophica bacterium]|nr:histone deacetylase [Candidatus Omnitrophota bacterium]